MGERTLLQQIKDSMRIKHSALDPAIEGDIEAATLDLVRVGVQPYLSKENKTLKEDALLWKAIELYSKGEEDYQGKGDKYSLSYEKLRDSLALCGDYNE